MDAGTQPEKFFAALAPGAVPGERGEPKGTPWGGLAVRGGLPGSAPRDGMRDPAALCARSPGSKNGWDTAPDAARDTGRRTSGIRPSELAHGSSGGSS